MTAKLDPKRCAARVWDKYRDYQCLHKPKADGFCGIHDPKRLAAKKAERDARYANESRLRSIGWEIDRVRNSVWRGLTDDSSDAQIVAVMRSALKKIAALEASK